LFIPAGVMIRTPASRMDYSRQQHAPTQIQGSLMMADQAPPF
jgi:hypothetical protein